MKIKHQGAIDGVAGSCHELQLVIVYSHGDHERMVNLLAHSGRPEVVIAAAAWVPAAGWCINAVGAVLSGLS